MSKGVRPAGPTTFKARPGMSTDFSDIQAPADPGAGAIDGTSGGLSFGEGINRCSQTYRDKRFGVHYPTLRQRDLIEEAYHALNVQGKKARTRDTVLLVLPLLTLVGEDGLERSATMDEALDHLDERDVLRIITATSPGTAIAELSRAGADPK
jgi:hypothetical protein